MEATQDSDLLMPHGTDVESAVEFFLKDGKGNYLAPKLSDSHRWTEEGTCVDEISKEMTEAEEGDAGYMANLRKLGKGTVGKAMRNSLTSAGQVVLLPEASYFETRVKSGPSEIKRLKYGMIIKLYNNRMRTLATPTVRENFHKFIIIRDAPGGQFPYYSYGETDPNRLATELFRVDFYDYPKDMKPKPLKPPPTGSLVYSNDQVQLVALRPSEETDGEPSVRGYANSIYNRSIGDVEWKPSDGQVYTFHYGSAYRQFDGPPPSTSFKNVETEDLYPRR